MKEHGDLAETVQRELGSAEEASDEARLETLEQLYRDLEGRLDRDVDQNGPSRH